MSARRLPAILAVVVAAVLVGAATWFLRGEGPASPPAPDDGSALTTPDAVKSPTDAVAVPLPPPPALKSFGRIRLVDEATRLPVPHGRGCSVSMSLEDGERRQVVPLPVQGVEDGRWVLAWPHGKSDDPRKGFPKSAVDAARVEVRVPGYERLVVDAAALDGEKEIALRSVPPSVRGEFTGGPGVQPESFTCELLPRGGELPPPGPVEPGQALLPDRPGPFRIYDVPPGNWSLVARAAVGTEVARVVRNFEKGEGTVELGEIRLVAPVTIRARVVGADGSGVHDAGLTLSRVGEGADLPAAGASPDKEGWVEFRGLEAGVEYLVTSSRFEGLRRSIHAPAEGGKQVPVELSTEIQGVRCRIRFTVHGQDPVKWGAILDGPSLDDGAWKKDGRLEQEMAPGQYGFSIEAQPAGKDGLRACSGKFTVPEGKRDFEATVDLREGE
jgi:hypothetical protein